MVNRAHQGAGARWQAATSALRHLLPPPAHQPALLQDHFVGCSSLCNCFVRRLQRESPTRRCHVGLPIRRWQQGRRPAAQPQAPAGGAPRLLATAAAATASWGRRARFPPAAAGALEARLLRTGSLPPLHAATHSIGFRCLQANRGEGAPAGAKPLPTGRARVQLLYEEYVKLPLVRIWGKLKDSS